MLRRGWGYNESTIIISSEMGSETSLKYFPELQTNRRISAYNRGPISDTQSQSQRIL
ncbi:hypothetical protein EMIT0P176_70226 [Pseudomonas sp. IT-P176]